MAGVQQSQARQTEIAEGEAAAAEAAAEEAAKEPPRKTITLRVPPGGQAPKPSRGSETEELQAGGSLKSS